MMTKQIGFLSFMIGLVLAIVAVFIDLGDWVTQLLIILGILTGLFHDIKNDVIRLGVIYLALAATAGALQNLVLIGPVVTDIVNAWLGFLGPVVLTAVLVWGTAYLFKRKKS